LTLKILRNVNNARSEIFYLQPSLNVMDSTPTFSCGRNPWDGSQVHTQQEIFRTTRSL